MSPKLTPFRRLPVSSERPAPVVPVSAAVRNIRPYEPVQSLEAIRAQDGPEPLKLDWNESTIAPAPGVLDAIASFISNRQALNWYPDLRCTHLVEELTNYVGVGQEQLLVTNGSDDALDLICKTYLSPDDRVLLPYPTYTHFLVFAGARDARFDPVTYQDPFVGEVDRIVQAITPWTRLIYLVNPNNPTGVLFSREEIRTIAERAPMALVVVDEAYYEFSGISVADMTEAHPNIVVTRTFSKSFGIAGLRVGYTVAHPQVISDLRRLFNPKSVNVLGQIAAVEALKDADYHERFVRSVKTSQQQLTGWFRSRGLSARSTAANWVLVRVPSAGDFVRALAEEAVYVRDRSGFPQLNGWVRMSVGTPEQTQTLTERTSRVLDRLGI